MKDLKNFTVEEKEILLAAVDHYIDGYEWARNLFTEEERDKGFNKISDLRIKLILDIYPIEVISNNTLNELTCYLCGREDQLGYPKTPMINGHDICFGCFEKFEPELYKKTDEANKQGMKAMEEYENGTI